ncbi:MAG: Uma2 family endonuclease [Phenylobacterium sp.]|jgi:Uma2 family endonuclease
MSTITQRQLITSEVYLEDELVRSIKHEYVNGEIFAMAGATPNHGRITGNVFGEFRTHLKGHPCEPFASDMKVKTSTGSYRYPDVMVVHKALGDNNFIDNGYVSQTPVIIVEVLSRTTRKIDERDKLMEYINIATLKEYVIIEQDVVDVTVYRKSDDWRCQHYFLGDDIHFESIDCRLAVEEIYHRVDNQDMNEFLAGKG